jgi:hypothetical protein
MQSPSRSPEFDSSFMPEATLRRGLSAQKAAETSGKSTWIDERLTRTFMANAHSGIWGLLIAMVVVVGMLYGYVSAALLSAWVVLVLVVTALRQHAINQYKLRKLALDPQPLQEFFRVRRWFWIGNAALWGGLV